MLPAGDKDEVFFCVFSVVRLMGHIPSPVCCSYSCEDFNGTIRFAGFILLTFSA